MSITNGTILLYKALKVEIEHFIKFKNVITSNPYAKEKMCLCTYLIFLNSYNNN